MTVTLRSACHLVVTAMDGQYPLEEALQQLRSAYEAHETRDGFAETCWSVDDVLGKRPEWTDEQAKDWLAVHAGRIQDAMVEAGWEAMDALLSTGASPSVPH